MNNINFYLPDFYTFQILNYQLNDLISKFSYKFNDNIRIAAIYGSFDGAIWNGGRIDCSPQCSDRDIQATINLFNSAGIPLRFTWTNSMIEEKHLNDEYCNKIMRFANNGINEVIVNSKILEQYLRSQYPNFKYLSSTTKCLCDNNSIEHELSNYYLTVLDYRKNHDMEFLSKLSQDQKDKVELLVNSYCWPDCSYREDHYKLVSEINISQQMKEHRGRVSPNCITGIIDFQNTLKYSCTITKEQLYNEYVANGFHNFKIEGRNFHIVDVIESYIYYLVKEEYQQEIRTKLLKIICPRRGFL